MNIRWVLQTVFLVVSLSATILAIIALKSNHNNDFLASLGFGGTKINWCEKRVARLKFKNLSEIKEVNSKWGVQTQDEHIIINYVEFEKWLAQFCLLKADVAKVENPLQQNLTPLFDVEYIDGEKLTIYRLGEDKFQIKQMLFKSSTLEQLIEQYLQFFPKNLRPPAQ